MYTLNYAMYVKTKRRGQEFVGGENHEYPSLDEAREAIKNLMKMIVFMFGTPKGEKSKDEFDHELIYQDHRHYIEVVEYV